jgi:hypothetical protein
MADIGTTNSPQMAPGASAYQALIDGGVPQQKADAWKQARTQALVDGGVPLDRIQKYWGEGQPTSATVSKAVAGNMQRAPQGSVSDPLTAFAAGWDHSVTGLETNFIKSGGTAHLPADFHSKDFMTQLAFAGGQEIGDLPTQLAGFVRGAPVGARIGGLAGAAVPGAGETGTSEAVGAAIGASVTGSASAGALTEGTRQSVILAYKRNEIHTWKQAVQAGAQAAGQTAKVTLASGAGGLAGPVAGKAVGMVAPEAVAAVSDIAANTATSTATGALLDHKVPDAQDFFTAASLALLAHGVVSSMGPGKVSPAESHVASNLQDIYVKTGIPPWEAAQRAKTDPKFREEVFAQDVNGDPVTPKFRYTAPSDPEPFTPPKRAFGAAKSVAERAGITPGETTVEQPGKELVPTFGTHELETVGKIETGGLKNPDAAISPKGAVGRFQIMPATARQYGFDPSRLHDPQYNAMVADTIIRDLNRRYGGNQNAVMIGYNAGPGRASEYLSKGPGTKLEATIDKNVRGGVRYERVPADRDEAFLPQETQEYLAKARLWGKGSVEQSEYDVAAQAPHGEADYTAPGRSIESEIAAEKEAISKINETETPEEPVAEQDLNMRKGASVGAGNVWHGATDDQLFDEMNANVAEQPMEEYKTANWIDDFGDKWVSEITMAKRIDDRLVQQGLLNRDKDLDTEDDFRLANYGWRGMAAHVLKYGGVDMLSRTPDKSIPSFFDAKAEALKHGKMSEWMAFMNAMRSQDKVKRFGIESGFNPMAAAEIEARLNDGNPKMQGFMKASQMLTQAQNGVLKMLRDSGYISADAYDRMVEGNPIYLPWREQQEDAPTVKRSGVSGRLAKVKGGAENLSNPFGVAIQNSFSGVKAALRNLAIGNLITRLTSDPAMVEQFGLKKVGELTPDENEVEAILKQYGYSKPPEDASPEALEQWKQLQSSWAQVISDRLQRKMGGNEFVYRNNGVLEKWTVNDPLIAQMIKGVNRPEEADTILKGLELVTRVVRAGVTLGTFPFRMAIWHQFNQFTMDPSHPPPVLTFYRGLIPALSGGKGYQELLASGGLVHISQDLTSDKFFEHMTTDELLEKTGFWDKAWNTFKEPMQWVEGLEAVSTRLDAANRIGIRQHAQNTLGQNAAKSAATARRAGLDYAERGTEALLGYMASLTAFWRPHILGMEQGYRAGFSSEASPTAKGIKLGQVLAAGVATILLPKIINYVLNREADKHLPVGSRYMDLPRNMRSAALITPPIAGQRFTFRLPANIGYIFGDIPERIMEMMYENNGHAFDGWTADLVREFVGPLLPDFATPITEVAANHNWNTGRPLVPDSLKNRLPEDRYTDYTSEPAKRLAAFTNPLMRAGHVGEGFSPMMFDHLVTGWGDQIGDGALAALNAPMSGGDTSDLKDVLSNIFVRGIIVRHPTASAQPLQDFYTELDAAREPYTSAMAQAKADRLGGVNPDEPLPAKSQRLAELERTEKAIQKLRITLDQIKDNPQMTLDDKRQHSEAVWDKITGVAFTALHPTEAAAQAQGSPW